VVPIDHAATHACLRAERALVAALGADCQTPVGALAIPVDETTIELVAAVAAPDGSRAVRANETAPAAEASALGGRIAARLVEQGAGAILADAHRAHDAVTGSQS
jgi:hydroxymethylbilane synthase